MTMSTEQTPHLDHQKIRGWKIWYSDTTVDSTQMSWDEAPDDDVQVVMIYFEGLDGMGRPTRLYSSGCDVYGLDQEAGTFSSHFDDPSKVTGVIKHGKYTNWQKLLLIEKMAFDDYGEGWLWHKPEKIEKMDI